MNYKKRHQQARIFQIKTDDLDSINLDYDLKSKLKKKKKQKNKNSCFKIKYENKNFASNSLFCLSNNNKFRQMIQKIVTSNIFTLIINIIIIINCIFLIFETINVLQITTIYSNYIFVSLFCLEAILKIIAYGFVLDQNTYLRDPWNWIDFIIVVAGIINLLFKINSNLLSLQVFRLLKPLKTMTYSSNLRMFFSTFMNSIKDVFIVFILLLFFGLIFAIVGLNLWFETFSKRCRINNVPIHGTFAISSDNFYKLCGGKFKCNNCLSSLSFFQEKTYFFLNNIEFQEELNYRPFNYGLTMFGNIGWSLLSIFHVTIGRGWNEIMLLIIDGDSYYKSVIFFFVCIILNYYIMLNLSVAVLFFNFNRARRNNFSYLIDEHTIKPFKENDTNKKKIILNLNMRQFTENVSKKKYQYEYSQIEKVKNEFLYEFEQKYTTKINKNFWKNLKKNFSCFIKIKKHSEYHKKNSCAFYCFVIYKQPFFQIFIYFCILLNTFILALDRVDLSEDEKTAYYNISCIILVIFIIEIIIHMIGVGIIKFVKDITNDIDFVIVAISLIEVIIDLRNNSGNISNISSIFQLLRIFRLFRLLIEWERFRIIFNVLVNTLVRTIDFLILFILFLFMYALLGFNFFKNSLKFNEEKYKANSNSKFYNFDNLPNAIVAVFRLLIGYEWYEIYFDCFRSDKNNMAEVLIYFITCILFGNILLKNVFLAYVIENFQNSLNHYEKNIKVHKFILYLINITSSYYESLNIDYDSIEKNKKNWIKTMLFNKFLQDDKSYSLYNYYLMKITNKKLEYEDTFEIVSKCQLDFQKLIVSNYTNYQNNYHSNIIFYDNNPKEIIKSFSSLDEKNVNTFMRYIENYENYYEFDVDYFAEEDVHTNDKINNTMKKNVEKIYEKYEKNKLNGKNIVKNLDNILIEEDETIVLDDSVYDEDEVKKSNNKLVNNNKNDTIDIKIHQKNSKSEPVFFNDIKKNNVKFIDEIKEMIDSNSFNEIQHNKTNKINIKKNVSFADTNSLNHLLSFNPFKHSKTFKRKNSSDNFSVKLPEARNMLTDRTKMIMRKNDLYLDDENMSNYNGESEYKLKSLFIFSPNNKFRLFCINILNHFLYKYIICIIILLNCIIIGLFGPNVNPKSNMFDVIRFLNIIFNLIFIIEAIIKIISLGFIFNEGAYLRDILNIIDLFCIFVGIIDFFRDDERFCYLRAFISLRLILLIRVIFKSDYLYLLTRTITKSVPSLSNILCLGLLFYIIFALVGVHYFKDDLNYICTIDYLIKNEKDCKDKLGKWEKNMNNFSNFLNALKNVFILMIGENWGQLMFLGCKVKNNRWFELYYIIVILICHMIFQFIIVAIFIQKFNSLKAKLFKDKIFEINKINLSEAENRWIKFQKLITKYKPKPKFVFNDKIRNFVNSDYFEYICFIFILLSAVPLAMKYNYSSNNYDNIITYLNMFFTTIFTIELILKIITYKTYYFYDEWNIFDFIIIIICDVMVILNILSIKNKIDIKKNFGSFLMSLRLLRILRILRKINIFGKMRSLIDTILYIIKNILYIGLLLLIFIFIYSCIGMAAFGKVNKRTYINNVNNFDNFYSSAILLFQIITTEDWVDVMNELAFHNCQNPNSNSYLNDNYCNNICYDEYISYDEYKNNNKFSCGTNFSYLYFISFMIIGHIFIMNLFIVIVIDGFNDSMFENEGKLSEDLIIELINLWKEYSPNANYFISQQDFILIFKQLSPPMGMNYDRFLIENINDNIKIRNKEYIQFESCKKIIEFNKKLDINKNIVALPEHYQYNNFYLSKNKKFYTTDKEIMKIIDKFNIKVYSPQEIFKDNNNNDENKINKYSYSFSALSNEKLNNNNNFSIYSENYVHFIDACIILSHIATSKITCVFYDKLRRNLVNKCTKKFWKKSYKNENIEKFFNHDDEEQKKKYKKLLMIKILNKFKNNIIEKTKKIREKLNKKNNSNNVDENKNIEPIDNQ